jgi:acylphosphatase
MSSTRATVRFKGRVQGVWFRAHTKQEADRHQIFGWVKNCPDGSVEAVFEGKEAVIKDLVAICQIGPPAARVEEIHVDWQPASGEFHRFEILH